MSTNPNPKIIVTGAGGFIGSHLVNRLTLLGYRVVGVDQKLPEFAESQAVQFLLTDLREPGSLDSVLDGASCVFALAADIGGMGHISMNEFTLLTNNTLIDTNTFESCARFKTPRVVYASSACVYPSGLQSSENSPALRESDAWPADPDGAYGFEKLLGEVALGHLGAQHKLSVAMPRFHNVYGPVGTFEGGREKVPAAICRKIASAVEGSPIEVWGDGEQSRSFCYIDDCIDALVLLVEPRVTGAINVGSERAVTINGLVELACSIARKEWIDVIHVPGPQGVRSRNSDSSLARQLLDWEPRTPLEDGLAATYSWVSQQLEIRAGKALSDVDSRFPSGD